MARSLRIGSRVLALGFLILVLSTSVNIALGAQPPVEPGGRATVSGVGPQGLSVHAGAGPQFQLTALVPNDTEVFVLEGPTLVSSVPWYLVTGYDGPTAQGWTSGKFLQAKQAEGQESSDSSTRTGSSRGNQELSPRHSFVGNVTAYCIQGRTASGTQVHWGTIAVDPSVVPLGTRIQIDGFDEVFVAEDTGGGVRGNWIDIWFPTCAEAQRFGTQSRRVTILE